MHPVRATVLGRAFALVVLLTVSLVGASCAVAPPRSDSDRVGLTWSGTGAPDFADVSYGAGPNNLADVYLPIAGGNRGVIVLVHAGAFYSGDRSDAKRYSGVIMAQVARGFAVVNVEYRLTTPTKNHFPAAVQDVSAAVEWVRAQGARYGLNPATVIVAGHSAGGTIAALVGVGANASPSGPLGRTAKVDGYISFAGILDFQNAAPLTNGAGKLWLGPNAASELWLAQASATTHLDPADPSGYLAQGDLDTMVEPAQVDHMIRALLSARAPYTKLFIDRVRSGESACRWHLPQCGVNATALNNWIDMVDQRQI